MNVYLVIILTILLGRYLLDLIVESLNIKSSSPVLPEEFVGFYDAEKYQKSQNYLKEKTHFLLIKETIFTVITIIFILVGGFNYVDNLARTFNLNPIPTGLIFAAILVLAIQLLDIPFSAYSVFVIEEKYGFNRTRPKTFVLDILKNWLLSAIVGGIVFSAILWFFGKVEQFAWIWCWISVTLFQFFLLFIAPILILPLFNKFVPLEDGQIKEEIEKYADSQDFKIKGIFKMDASRRSTKANAFFVGFGKYRRIALFDNLIAKHTVDELVSILAHEIGHYKQRHILKRLGISIGTWGIMFFILSLLINNPRLFAAFKMEKTSIYASLFFFGFLYAPLSLVFSVVNSFLFRRQEFQADNFAITTFQKPSAYIEALKKLTVTNLANLTPHPLKVFLDYSHPPILQRIRAIRRLG